MGIVEARRGGAADSRVPVRGIHAYDNVPMLFFR